MPFKKQKEKLNKHIEDSEPLVRYIFSRSHFSQQRIKSSAFLPARDKKISVIRSVNSDDDCILKIGHKISEKRKKKIKIACSIKAKEVRSNDFVENKSKLDVVSDTTNNQHRRHANIIGFNNYKEAEEKRIAKKLADKATLILKNKFNKEIS